MQYQIYFKDGSSREADEIFVDGKLVRIVTQGRKYNARANDIFLVKLREEN